MKCNFCEKDSVITVVMTEDGCSVHDPKYLAEHCMVVDDVWLCARCAIERGYVEELIVEGEDHVKLFELLEDNGIKDWVKGLNMFTNEELDEMFPDIEDDEPWRMYE